MAKRATKEDFARVRAILQREDKAGASFEEAAKTAEAEEPEAFKRIVKSPGA